MIRRLNKLSLTVAALLIACVATTAGAQQAKRRPIHVFIDVKETNLDKSSTVAKNTLSEKLTEAGFHVTTKRREADMVVDGTISSRLSPVTDEVKREGGVNAEAVASVRLLLGSDVVSTSVERSAPGDWGVMAERVGEDRLIEVAGLVAEDLFSERDIKTIYVIAPVSPPKEGPKEVKTARKPSNSKRGPKRGMSFMEVAWLVQNFAPEDRIVGALRKYGIKFKPLDSAVSQLRNFGATDGVINAVKSSTVV
ncbi:MAG TPA: hypothetical protein VFY40_16600 [Blastocatellia bacterium]|nr:hypothetical protein [Blastocatellia bacterium]